jgi:hypothetical protein
VDTLNSFSRHYASGDLNALLRLFSRRANAGGGGGIALAVDYAKLFDGTRDRAISLSDLRWQREGDQLRGGGRFEATYYKKGGLFRQVVRGHIGFVLVEEDGAARLLRLDSRPVESGS